MKAREHAIACLREYMRRNFSGYNGCANRASFLRRTGLTESEFENLLSGDKLLDEPRFYKLLEVCRDCDYTAMRGKCPDWYIETPNWKLIGLVERTLTLEKTDGTSVSDIQGIVKSDTVIIDDPELSIEEGDVILHRYGLERVERLTVSRSDSFRNQTDKPAYVLTVRRISAAMKEKEQHNIINISGENNNVNNVVQGNSSPTVTVNQPEDSILKKVLSILSSILSCILSFFGLGKK